jgi:hypothetical protein
MLVFLDRLGTVETLFQLMRAVYHARKAEEEGLATGGV